MTSEFGAKTRQASQGQAEQGSGCSAIRGSCWCTIEDVNMAHGELVTAPVRLKGDFITQTGAIKNVAAEILAVALSQAPLLPLGYRVTQSHDIARAASTA